MTVLFSPAFNGQYFDANGDPAVGYTVTTYAAGSSTLLATYTDSGGLSANANPVTLNAAGLNPNGQFWLTSGLSYKFVVKDSGGVTVQTVDGVAGVNDPTSLTAGDQWIAYSGTPTYISATSFSLVGDQTSRFHIGRRVTTSNTGGAVYSAISASSFGAGVTTVTVVNDGVGVLDSGLSAVSYALLSQTNPSIPAIALVNIATVQATTSGTSKDFTGIPSWVRRVTLNLAGVSTNGTSALLVQIGAGSVSAASYVGNATAVQNAAATSISAISTGFGIVSGAAANLISGSLVLTLMDAATGTWAASGNFAQSAGSFFSLTAGHKVLSGTLDRIRLTTITGADTFDAGSANISYE